jgi:hypothetical protein
MELEMKQFLEFANVRAGMRLLVAMLCILCGAAAFGQGIITGGITGMVVDQTGAVIPGATVVALNESTGSMLTVQSNGQGAFTISDVPLGSYTLNFKANGFGPAQLTHVRVVAGNATSVGPQALRLGSEAQTVQVEADAAQLINTESPQMETTIDSEQVATAPVTGAIDNLALVVPGVVGTHADGMSNTNGENFSVNGQRGRSNNSEIDGQTNNDTSIGGPSFFFDNQDAVQEVQVVSADMGAQYGRNMGAIVNYITKSGTNTFHGSGFEIYTGSWLSSMLQDQKAPQWGFCPGGSNAAYAAANGCSVATDPRFVQNNWGGTLGGPILKDRLWFFGSTLWSHTYEGAFTVSSAGGLFPDQAGLSTLKSAYPNNAAVQSMVANGPYSSAAGNPTAVPTTAAACAGAGGTLTGSGFCDITVTDGNTFQTVETAGYSRVIPNNILDQEHLGRVDWQITPKDRLYLRYNYQNNPYSAALYLVSSAAAAGGGYPGVTGVTHEAGGDWTHTFTPSMLNQLRYAFQQANIAFENGAIPTCTIGNETSCSSSVSLGGSFAGYGYAGNLPQGRFVKVNQVQDNASWTRGKHTILFGGETDYQDSPWGWIPNAQGVFNFAYGVPQYTSGPNAGNVIPQRFPAGSAAGQQAAAANALTNMLEGISSTALAAGSPSIPFKETDFDLYFQDNWKVMPNLTLNLGLRYEFFGQAVNFLHTESVNQQTGSNPFWNTSLPLSATTTPYVNPVKRNIEPRLGFSYNPTSLPKMVVHGGFSINADPEFYAIFVNMATAAPVLNQGTFGCDGVTINCTPNNGWNFGTVQAADKQFIPTGGDPRANPLQTVPSNFKNPMGETYSLGFQYQVAPSAVATVGYVGNHSFGLFQALNTNPDILDVQSAFPNYGAGTTLCTDPAAPGYTRPNCNYSLVTTFGNTAFSLYNALQTSLTLRNFHHWSGTASYTYSRTIDNASEFASTGSGGQASAYAQDPLNTDMGERAVSGNSYPNVWGMQLNYAEPWFTNQHGILGRILGGYSMNMVYQYNGGQPYNPLQTSVAVSSPAVLADIGGTGSINATTAGAINPAEAETSFCDAAFANYALFGPSCRPILSNPRAPLQSVGINLGPGGYVDYATGAPTTAAAEHWLWNNQYQAIAQGNPFPGVGRNILRGDSFNNVDLSVGKTLHVTERVSMNLMVSAFNVLNRAYYGTPDINIEHNPLGLFLTNQFAGTSSDSGAGGGSYPAGLGNRNMQLSGKIIF